MDCGRAVFQSRTKINSASVTVGCGRLTFPDWGLNKKSSIFVSGSPTSTADSILCQTAVRSTFARRPRVRDLVSLIRNDWTDRAHQEKKEALTHPSFCVILLQIEKTRLKRTLFPRPRRSGSPLITSSASFDVVCFEKNGQRRSREGFNRSETQS